MQNKKWLSGLLSLSLVFSFVPVVGLAAEYTDTKEHWASAEIAEWSDKSILQGSDGLFRPEAPITRGEMAIILDRVMKYQDKASNTFADLNEDWYTDAILKANAAGIVRGDGSTVRPLDNITREEAAVMFGRALGLAEVSGASSFADSASISSWATGYVNAMSAKNFVSGVGANQFSPNAPITRGEIVKMLDNAVQGFYTTTGTYGETVTGTAVVNASGVTLKDATINGDLIIAEGVGSGEVTLENVKVTGQTIVRGGGENSIIVKGDSTLGKMIVDKKSSAAVSVKISGNAKVDTVVATNGSLNVTGTVNRLDVQGDVAVKLVGAKVETVNVTTKAAVTVDKASTVTTMSVAAASSSIQVAGTVTTITTTKDAANTSIKTETGAKVTTVVAQAEGTTITGTGAITNVKAEANDVAVSTPNTKVEAATGTSGVTAGGSEVKAGSNATTNNSGSGSTGTTTPPSGGSSGGSSGGGSSGGSSNPGTPTSTAVTGLYPAILNDISSPAIPADQLVSDYKVSALKWSDKAYVDVAITGNNLKYHQNGAGTNGSWIGFAIPAPKDAVKMKTSFAYSQVLLSLGEPKDLDERVYIDANNVEYKGAAFYSNASNENIKTWAQVEWLDKDGKSISNTVYRIDLKDVKLDSSFVLDAENTANGITAAVTGISESADKKTTTYNVTLSGAADYGLGGDGFPLNYSVIHAALVGEGQAASYVTLKDLYQGNVTVSQTNPALKYYLIDGVNKDTITLNQDGTYTKSKEHTNVTEPVSYVMALLNGKDITVSVTDTATTVATVYVIKNEVTISAPAAKYELTNDATIAAGQTITIAKDKKLIVPADMTLTVEGKLEIQAGATLEVKGTLVNKGTILNSGTLITTDATKTGMTGDGILYCGAASTYTVGTDKRIGAPADATFTVNDDGLVLIPATKNSDNRIFSIRTTKDTTGGSVTLNKSYTIPAGCFFDLRENGLLKIAKDTTLTLGNGGTTDAGDANCALVIVVGAKGIVGDTGSAIQTETGILSAQSLATDDQNFYGADKATLGASFRTAANTLYTWTTEGQNTGWHAPAASAAADDSETPADEA